MELKVIDKSIRLDQLTAEVRALPGLSEVQGLSACGPSADGTTVITVHVGDKALTADEEGLVREAVQKHAPDPSWGASKEEAGLAALLTGKEGSLTLEDIENGLRLLAALVLNQPASQGAI